MSINQFADLGVSDAVTAALTRRGMTEPFPIQRLVIGDILAGRDVLAKSPTGSGKTLAFAIPIADRIAADGPRQTALVLAPTRELASQIVEEARAVAHARALKIAAVYGGVGIAKQAREAGKAHIIVATPGRLEDLIERRAVSLSRVRFLVVDEGDRMLDMGFRPALDRIVGRCPAERQTMFFSATLEGEAGKAAREYTRDPVRHEHTPRVDRRPAIEHRFVAVRHSDRVDALVRELHAERGPTLVFVRTKRGADRLVKRLAGNGLRAAAMHGDKSQVQRERVLEGFGSGRLDTLVATDVASRGIHVEGISHVINYDPPADRDGYVHRVGRTGRAGRAGVGTTLVAPDQAKDVSQIAGELALEAEFERSGLSSRRASAGPHRPGSRSHGHRTGRRRSQRRRA